MLGTIVIQLGWRQIKFPFSFVSDLYVQCLQRNRFIEVFSVYIGCSTMYNVLHNPVFKTPSVFTDAIS